MLRTYCKSKLDRIKVTKVQLEYDGSIELDLDLIDAAKIDPWEQVQVVNLENGNRLWTYVIPAERGSGIVSLKGPAARSAMVDDRIIVISYFMENPDELFEYKPITVSVDGNNKITNIK